MSTASESTGSRTIASESTDSGNPLAPGLALFGTSADPPTTGHRALLSSCFRLMRGSARSSTSRCSRAARWASEAPCCLNGLSLAQVATWP